MKLRCKPGCLARVNRCSNPSHVGHIVECVRFVGDVFTWNACDVPRAWAIHHPSMDPAVVGRVVLSDDDLTPITDPDTDVCADEVRETPVQESLTL